MKKISIIIPVFNEKSTILELLAKVDLADLGEIEKEIPPISGDFPED